ncbi:hypothetical protein C8Q76DRAFT_566962, partial [Earliella scabrosa]
VFGFVGSAAHELLEAGADVLKFAPVPGLEVAARALLNIWDAIQLVHVNRAGCLQLTEQCATVLAAVREEIAEAGDEVARALQRPVKDLVESYCKVEQFLVKLSRRSIVVQYLQRKETKRALADCRGSLQGALDVFNVR